MKKSSLVLLGQRICALVVGFSGVLLCVSPASLANAVIGTNDASETLLIDFCQTVETTTPSPAPTTTTATSEKAAATTTTTSPTVTPVVSTTPTSTDQAEDEQVEDAQARACSDQADRALLNLDDPQVTVVADRTALTELERAAIAQAVQVANEHLLDTTEASTTSTPTPTSSTPVASSPSTTPVTSTPVSEPDEANSSNSVENDTEEVPGITTETETGSMVPIKPSSADSAEIIGGVTDTSGEETSDAQSPEEDSSTQPDADGTPSQSDTVRPLTSEELTYREGQTVPADVTLRVPGIYVDAIGQAGVVFNDGSMRLFTQDVTVVEAPLAKRRSARSAMTSAPLLAAADGTTVPAPPDTTTATVFNGLYLHASTMPSEIIVDSTRNGNGTGGVQLDGQTSSRSNESKPASNKSNPLIITNNQPNSSGGQITVRSPNSQATVWYSDVSNYDNGRYQPPSSDSRAPLALAPRMTVSSINLTNMTATVTYQFYYDFSAYVSRNNGVNGVFVIPYARYRSDPSIGNDPVSRYFIPDPQGRTLADKSEGGTGTNTGNCRGVWVKKDMPTAEKATGICLSLARSGQYLSATVPIEMVEGATFTYRIMTGFNSDWFVATMSGSNHFDFMLPSEFNTEGTYTNNNNTTYHLLETIRVQIPDVVVSTPVPTLTLPLTGGVSDVAYMAAGAGLLLVAVLLLVGQVCQQRTRNQRLAG